MRHGLTTPVESSVWATPLQSLEALLESDGIETSKARKFALSILNYERNVQYQRERYADLQSDAPHKPSHSGTHLRRSANQLIKQMQGVEKLMLFNANLQNKPIPLKANNHVSECRRTLTC